MRAFIGITDGDWFELLRSRPDLPEANFWQPGGNRVFGALEPGEIFLFKLHSPRNFIVGGGVFVHSSLLPTSLAWKSFGVSNGAESLEEMRHRIERYRRRPSAPTEDYRIGCIILTQPFFFTEENWISAPTDFHPNIVQGKTYDLVSGLGADLWAKLQLALAGTSVVPEIAVGVQDGLRTPRERYGKPVFVRPRLGQGAFRVVVTDAYERRCALTGERVLPVLQAAHVRPYSSEGAHAVENGLLLRSDLHALFDDGYLTVTPELHLEVSRRIREEFDNGREYYALHGRALRAPRRPYTAPSRENLVWHNERSFKG